MWRITVDNACIGSGSCVGIAPGRFELNDADGHAHPVQTDIEPDDAVLDAAASCPMEAISLVDLTTGEPVEID